jgi:hypothetical protein
LRSSQRLCYGALAELAVQLEVDALVEEAAHVSHRLRVVLRIRVRPDEIVVELAARAEL